MKYKLTLDEEQAKVLIDALDLYARLRIGQIEEVGHTFRFRGAADPDKELEQFEQVDAACKELKRAMFPDLHPNASYGIGSQKTPKDAQVAWEIHGVVRHRMAWDKTPKGGMQVWFDETMKYSGVPLPTIEHEESKPT